MIKNTLAVLVLGSCIASPVFSSSIISQLQSNDSVANKAKNVHAGNYTDFSGSWSGPCTADNGQSETVNLEISNNANSISIGGNRINIGALTTLSTSSHRDTDFNHLATHWNNEKTVLTMTGVLIKHPNSFPIAHSVRPMQASLFRIGMSLNEGQLIINEGSVTYEGLQQDKSSSQFSCTLSKAE